MFTIVNNFICVCVYFTYYKSIYYLVTEASEYTLRLQQNSFFIQHKEICHVN